MKYIEATQQEIVYHRISRIPAIEITSYEQLSGLDIDTKVAIMDNMMMVIGKIYSKDDGYISVYDGVRFISVYPSSFEYGNYIYEII